MALTDKLTAVADAIRAKTGGAARLTLDQMVAEIAGISGGAEAQLDQAELPGYVRDEVAGVVAKARAAQTDATLTIVAVSDPHHCASQPDGWAAQTNESDLHAMMALKALCYSVSVDAVALNGDLTFGNASTTAAQLAEQVAEVKAWLAEATGGVPALLTVGNHDTGEYSTLMGAGWCAEAIMGASDATAFGGAGIGNPCYLDLPDKKVRVINLNTCEGEASGSTDYCLSDGQMQWFADALKDVGSRSDAAEWGIVIVGHYPLDFGGARYCADILKAYMDGSTYSRGGVSADFAGANGATFVCNLHGHTHCLRSGNMSFYGGGSVPTEFPAVRLATPAMNFYRNNEYTSPVYGQVFGENMSYTKTARTGKDTSFTVNVIDLAARTINSFCYGAGYDRELTYVAQEGGGGDPASYTNLIPLSTTTIGGTELYNDGLGYKTGYRVNSASVETAASGMCCTGFMPVPAASRGNASHTLRIRGVTVEGDKSSYLLAYSPDAASAQGFQLIKSWVSSSLVADESGLITVEADGVKPVTAYRLSVGVIDGNSVFTVDEEIAAAYYDRLDAAERAGDDTVSA